MIKYNNGQYMPYPHLRGAAISWSLLDGWGYTFCKYGDL